MKLFGATITILLVQLILFFSFWMSDLNTAPAPQEEKIATELALNHSFSIDINTVGELEAADSISISSPLRSDQARIIDIIADGTHVSLGDILMKIDPTPFENRIEEIKAKVLENESQVVSLKQALDWEIVQLEHETKATLYDLEAADMELNKIIKGDGPLEIARLKQAMQKAESKFNEVNFYAVDLEELEKEGYLLPVEAEQTRKKIVEEKENYESAKLQYDTYVDHVFPMLVKKSEAHIKRTYSTKEENERNGKYKIKKAEDLLTQAQQQLVESKRQLADAEYELFLTILKAPSAGMVVLREEFRNSQKRKPRVGDVLIRNQPILDLPDLSKMIVKTKIREIDLYKIDINKPATIEVDAYPHMQFEGKVSFIGILAIADQTRLTEEKSFEVKLVVEQTDPRLRPGMTARVVIHAGKVEDSLAIPVHAVFELDKKHFCYVAKENGYVKQPVILGKSNDHLVEIYDGLEEYDQVCLSKPQEEQILAPEEEI